MEDLGSGKMASHEAGHPFPCPAASATLAAATNRSQPQASDALEETAHLPRVERHGMKVQPALYNTSQPASRFTKRAMHSLAQFLADRMERRPQAFADAVSMDCEPSVCPSLGDHMGKTKKVERLWSALAPPFSIFVRMSAEFDETGFLRVEL